MRMQWLWWVLIGVAVQVYAQDEVQVLKQKLKNPGTDTAKCNILFALVEVASDEEWPLYNDTLLAYTEEKLKKGTPEKKFYELHMANALANKSLVIMESGDLIEALRIAKKGLAIQEAYQDEEGIAASLTNMSEMYTNTGDIQKALDCCERALKIRERIHAKPIELALVLNNLSVLYGQNGNIRKAIEYSLRIEKILIAAGIKFELATCYNNLGKDYASLGQFDLAIEYYNKNLAIADELKDEKISATTLANIGMVFRKKGDNAMALKYLMKAEEIKERVKDLKSLGMILINLGGIYVDKSDYKTALKYTNRCSVLAGKTNSLRLKMDAARQFYEVYRRMGQPEKALINYEKYIQLNDSFNSIANKKATIKSQLKYEYEKKAAADSVKTAEEKKVVQAQLKQEQAQRYSLLVGLLLVVIFALFMVNRFRITNKQKKMIEEQKRMVERQKYIVEEKQREILDSIYYARRIQRALITNEHYIRQQLTRLKK